MSELAAQPLQAVLSWDNFHPGKLRYTLGPLTLLHNGLLINGTRRAQIQRGQAIIIMRNFILYYPSYCTYETLADRIWPDPDKMPLGYLNCIKKMVCDLNHKLPRVGALAQNRTKLGYRLKLIGMRPAI